MSVMYGYESWTIKKAENRRSDVFELWCRRRLLRVPWTARRSIQSILKEISPEYSLEGLMLKLKLQYLATWCEELTHWKRPWCRKRLKARGEGETEDEMVGWHHWLNGHGSDWSPGVADGQGSLACYSPWGHRESATNEQLNWRKYATGKDAIHLKYTKHVFRCYSKNNNNNTKRR